MQDDCTSSGIVTVLSDGNRAIALSGNGARPTLQQMQEFYHSRPRQEIEPEEVVEEEPNLNIKVLFVVNNGEEGYEFFIGGDRATPVTFLQHTPTLADITRKERYGFLNNTGGSIEKFRAHAGVLEISQKAAENSGCCGGEYINEYTGETTPFSPPPGWVARVTVEPADFGSIVVFVPRSRQESGSQSTNYYPWEDGFFNSLTSSNTNSLTIAGGCDCNGEITPPPYVMKVRVTITNSTVSTVSPEGYPDGDPNIDDTQTTIAVFGITDIQHPVPGSLTPPGNRRFVELLSWEGTEDPPDTDSSIFAYRTFTPDATIAYFEGLDDSGSENPEAVEGVIIAPTGSLCTDIGLESVYDFNAMPPGWSPPLGDACRTFSQSSASYSRGFNFLTELKLRDYYAETTCGNLWQGQILQTCEPILQDTYSYCVQLPFDPDPKLILERKPKPIDDNSVFDGWVGIKDDDSSLVELPRPGINMVCIVKNVEFAFCSADPLAYRLVYKWRNPEDDAVNPGEQGQTAETGEGLPEDTVEAKFADQNWFDWRVKADDVETQEGRINSLPVFSNTAPKNLVLPALQIQDSVFVASSPNRQKAIAKLGSTFKLYSPAGFVADVVLNENIATLLNSYTVSINWAADDVIYVVEADGSTFKTTNADVSVLRAGYSTN